MSWRDTKRKALSPVHETFSIPAIYLTHAQGTPTPINVRLHQRPAVIEMPGGDWSTAGQMLDIIDRIIYSTSEIAEVLTDSFIILSDSEAYLTGPSRPEREGFVWVEVSDVSSAQLAALLADADTTADEWKVIPPWSQQ